MNVVTAKAMVINSPSNPTGVAYSRAELQALADEHGGRFELRHVLDTAPPAWDGGVGRLDADTLGNWTEGYDSNAVGDFANLNRRSRLQCSQLLQPFEFFQAGRRQFGQPLAAIPETIATHLRRAGMASHTSGGSIQIGWHGLGVARLIVIVDHRRGPGSGSRGCSRCRAAHLCRMRRLDISWQRTHH